MPVGILEMGNKSELTNPEKISADRIQTLPGPWDFLCGLTLTSTSRLCCREHTALHQRPASRADCCSAANIRRPKVTVTWLDLLRTRPPLETGVTIRQLPGCLEAAFCYSISSSNFWSDDRKWHNWPILSFSKSLVLPQNESNSVLPNSHEPRVGNHTETKREWVGNTSQKLAVYKWPSIFLSLSELFIWFYLL